MTVRDQRTERRFFVDNDVIDKYAAKLGVYGLSVYMVLVRHANPDGTNSWPGMSTVAEKLGIDIKTARKYAHMLHDFGLVRIVERRRDDGSQTSNEYLILDPPTVIVQRLAEQMPGPPPVRGEGVLPPGGSGPPTTQREAKNPPSTNPQVDPMPSSGDEGRGRVAAHVWQRLTETESLVIKCPGCGVGVLHFHVDNRDTPLQDNIFGMTVACSVCGDITTIDKDPQAEFILDRVAAATHVTLTEDEWKRAMEAERPETYYEKDGEVVRIGKARVGPWEIECRHCGANVRVEKMGEITDCVSCGYQLVLHRKPPLPKRERTQAEEVISLTYGILRSRVKWGELGVWHDDIVRNVTDLPFWKEVLTKVLENRYNPQSMAIWLQCYRERRLPGARKTKGGTNDPSPEQEERKYRRLVEQAARMDAIAGDNGETPGDARGQPDPVDLSEVPY